VTAVLFVYQYTSTLL